MNALRSYLYVVLFVLWTVVVALVSTPLLFGPRRWTHAMFQVWGAGVVGLLAVGGVRVELRGREHIPAGAALVAPKHQCMLDVFAQFRWLPASAFVMKKELAWIPWFGWYGKKAGAIVIDRAGAAKTMRQVIREGTERFSWGAQVVIFPEGHRQPIGAPPDYKPGIAALYRELDVPVYPVATNAGEHWSAKGLRLTPGLIVYQYLPPIPPGLKRADFMRRLEEQVETASAALLGN
ncbi:MAG TPA: lysophospholipid acyltransferase family protein [Phenylobacterium sp.]|nr:lysophospholipid acyltransferase family protein [Phenylobacterium sp.]